MDRSRYVVKNGREFAVTTTILTAQGWKQHNFLLCDLQEVVRQSDQAMIDALQRIRFGDYTAIEYFSKNARKKPFSSEEGVVYLCVKNRTAERINDVRVSKLSGQCDLRRDELRS